MHTCDNNQAIDRCINANSLYLFLDDTIRILLDDEAMSVAGMTNHLIDAWCLLRKGVSVSTATDTCQDVYARLDKIISIIYEAQLRLPSILLKGHGWRIAFKQTAIYYERISNLLQDSRTACLCYNIHCAAMAASRVRNVGDNIDLYISRIRNNQRQISLFGLNDLILCTHDMEDNTHDRFPSCKDTRISMDTLHATDQNVIQERMAAIAINQRNNAEIVVARTIAEHFSCSGDDGNSEAFEAIANRNNIIDARGEIKR